jgi:hypothetical protein
MACVYGYADGLSQLDTDIVLAVIQDKKQSGLLPLYNLGGRLDRQDLESAIEASVTASCADEGTYDLAPPPGGRQPSIETPGRRAGPPAQRPGRRCLSPRRRER